MDAKIKNSCNDLKIQINIHTPLKSVNLSDTKMDVWTHIFKCCNLDINKNYQLITAKEIKAVKKSWTGKKSQFEPRLLCKMDSSSKRPTIFKDNNICIFSVKNGTYGLIKYNLYKKLKHDDSEKIRIKDCNANNIVLGSNKILNIGNSESSNLDKMQYSGMLDEIIGEKVKMGPLLGGRHRCSFKTIIGNMEIIVKGAQYETDGVYITDNYVVIVEAKSNLCEDFNIRQLYYPYREIHKTNIDKNIIALFICKDKKTNIIHINKYKWNNYLNMTDLEDIVYYKYKFSN